MEKSKHVFPTINLKETGINLRRIMDKRGITPKDIKEYLNLTSVQSVYNWCSGINMPTIDNLYALSQWFEVPIDAIICGNRKSILSQNLVIIESPRDRRLYSYYKKLNELVAAWIQTKKCASRFFVCQELKYSLNDKIKIFLQN